MPLAVKGGLWHSQADTNFEANILLGKVRGYQRWFPQTRFILVDIGLELGSKTEGKALQGKNG